MKLFGIEVFSKKEVTANTVRPNSWWGMFGPVLEPFAGAWQRNVVADRKENLLAFSAVYACIALISEDIAKLALHLLDENETTGVKKRVRRSPYANVLLKPNDYQTTLQFINLWLVMRLMYGNTYVLKSRDPVSGIVQAMYVLDSRMVQPQVTNGGSVFYQINQDYLNGVDGPIQIPASEIIHDRGPTLFHPLLGVSPLFACGASATQGIRIQNNSTIFFENMSRPSGQLTADGHIEDETANRIKRDFEANFSGSRIGRLFVSGDGLKYEPITIPAQEAQLIEQLKWTVEDVARCFKVPLHKIASGANPTFNNVGAMNQDYYTQTLQYYMEGIEALLDDGLGLTKVRDKLYCVEFDLEGLMRLDPAGRADVVDKKIKSGVLKPNEARAMDNLDPVEGGDTPYLQEQNYSLAALNKRDTGPDPFGKKPQPSAAPALPAPAAAPQTPQTDGSSDKAVRNQGDDLEDLETVLEFANTLLNRISRIELNDV